MTALRIAQAEEMVDHRLDVLAARDNCILLSSRRRIVDSCFIAIVLIAGARPQRYMLDLIAGKRAPEKGKPEEFLLADIGIDIAAHISEQLRNFRQDGRQIELLLECLECYQYLPDRCRRR